MKDKLIDEKELQVGLIKMIKAVNGRFDYYSISPKIRQFFCFEVMN